MSEYFRLYLNLLFFQVVCVYVYVCLVILLGFFYKYDNHLPILSILTFNFLKDGKLFFVW